MSITFSNNWRQPEDGYVDFNNELHIKRLLERLDDDHWQHADRYPMLQRLHHSVCDGVANVDINVERGIHNHGDMRLECSNKGMHWYVAVAENGEGKLRISDILPCPV